MGAERMVETQTQAPLVLPAKKAEKTNEFFTSPVKKIYTELQASIPSDLFVPEKFLRSMARAIYEFEQANGKLPPAKLDGIKTAITEIANVVCGVKKNKENSRSVFNKLAMIPDFFISYHAQLAGIVKATGSSDGATWAITSLININDSRILDDKNMPNMVKIAEAAKESTDRIFSLMANKGVRENFLKNPEGFVAKVEAIASGLKDRAPDAFALLKVPDLIGANPDDKKAFEAFQKGADKFIAYYDSRQ